VSVQQTDDEATLSVHDNGVGFDLAEAEARRSGMGLTSMQERVDLLGGRLEINTAKGSGTTISATVPLDAASKLVPF
jgi:signal transduction histidine kinase